MRVYLNIVTFTLNGDELELQIDSVPKNETSRKFICKLILLNSLSMNSKEFNGSAKSCYKFDDVFEAQHYSEIFRNCPKKTSCNHQGVLNMCMGELFTTY